MVSFAVRVSHLVLAVALIASGVRAAAQSVPENPAPKIERHRLRSEILGQERELLVRTPADYAESRAPYPVLYVTDGDRLLPLLSEVVRYLAGLGRMPELVIVGIPHVDRTHELTPTRATLPGNPLPLETSGGADAFLDFLEKEVVPFVEARYRTVPLRILGGHSFGGLFALHAMTERPGLFRAFVAASPTLTWDGELPLKRTRSLVERRPDVQATLYYTVGDEGAALSDAFRRFGEIVGKGPKLRAVGVHLPGEDHGSVVLDTFHRGLRTVFEDWRMPIEGGAIGPKGGLAAVEAHYARLSERLGIVVAPPEAMLNLAGYQALQEGRVDDAIATLRRCVEIYGETSPNAHDSLGEAYEKKGELALALASYARAAELGAQRRDPLTPVFRANHDRVKKLVGEPKR